MNSYFVTPCPRCKNTHTFMAYNGPVDYGGSGDIVIKCQGCFSVFPGKKWAIWETVCLIENEKKMRCSCSHAGA